MERMEWGKVGCSGVGDRVVVEMDWKENSQLPTCHKQFSFNLCPISVCVTRCYD